MKRNTITFYITDQDKDIYKAFKEKAKKDGTSISTAFLNLMKKEVKA